MTDSDIQNFANLTWDHFYAHTDITSLRGSIFEKRAAHGYFILAAAAGLFVHPGKGPVGANYGLDECRFLRPIYHNDTLQVRLTCKEKVDRDARGKEYPSGVVKWYEEVFDQDGELVAMATILTLVQKKCPFPDVTREYIENGLAQLTEDSKPSWGIMTTQHLVEHFEYWFQVAMGKVHVKIITPEEKIEKLQETLYNHFPMPKSFDHPVLRKGKTEDLRFKNLAESKTAMLQAYDDYLVFFKENPEIKTPNSVFGNLDHEEWDLLNRKHFYHHFQQFGVL